MSIRRVASVLDEWASARATPACPRADRFVRFWASGELVGQQSSPKCEIRCPGRWWTTVQNLTPLALSSAKKSAGLSVQTNKHTHNYKKTVTDISTPCLSACVDKNRLKWSKNANFTYPNCIWRPLWGWSHPSFVEIFSTFFLKGENRFERKELTTTRCIFRLFQSHSNSLICLWQQPSNAINNEKQLTIMISKKRVI